MYDTPTAPGPLLELLDVSLDENLTGADTAPSAPPRSTAPWRRVAIGAAVVVAVTLATVLWAASRPGPPVTTSELALPPATAPVGIEGFAELYVAVYLTAEGDDGIAEVRRFYPTAPDGAVGAATDRYVMRTAALEARPVASTAWELVVAADVLRYDGVGYTPEGTHHYLVAVAVTDAGLAATSLPTRIAAPGPAPVVATETGQAVEDAGVLAVVDGFLRAYLTGEGDLRSYVAGTEAVAPIDPAPYATVTTTGVTGHSDGEGLRLRVLAEAREAGGRTAVVEYHLSVVIVGGAVKVGAVHAGPTLIEQAGGSDGDELGDA